MPKQKYNHIQKYISSNTRALTTSLVDGHGEFKSDDWDYKYGPSGSLDGDKTGFARKHLNSLKTKIDLYGKYFVDKGIFEDLILDDPNVGKGAPEWP